MYQTVASTANRDSWCELCAKLLRAVQTEFPLTSYVAICCDLSDPGQTEFPDTSDALSGPEGLNSSWGAGRKQEKFPCVLLPAFASSCLRICPSPLGLCLKVSLLSVSLSLPMGND